MIFDQIIAKAITDEEFKIIYSKKKFLKILMKDYN